jgi:DNA polymerase-3 subunit delta'
MWQLVGQDKAVVFLSRSLDAGRLAHAYLFSGPRHVGKMTLAQNLAQAVNCDEENRPCRNCRSCRRIASGIHPDVQVIGRGDEGSAETPKKEISIDQMRQLQHAASLKPYEGRYRVFIIDGAEHLSEEGANSLLKTLEEPAPHVILVLLTTDYDLLLPTIISRCQRVELFPVPSPITEQALIEHWGAAAEKAEVLARVCHGGIGWAISALNDDRLLQERAQKLERLISLHDASIEQRFAYAAQLATQFTRNRDLVREELELWRGWCRDLLLIKGGCANLVANIDKEALLHRQARGYSLTQIKGFIKAIDAALQQLEQNANPRLVLEVLMLAVATERKARYA